MLSLKSKIAASPRKRCTRGEAYLPNAEELISPVRLLCLICAFIVYFGMFDRSQMNESITLPALAFLTAYCLTLQFLKPYRYLPGWISNTLITFIDAIATGMWICVTGWSQSPFFVIMFVSITTIALRFGVIQTLVTALFYTVLYTLIYVYSDDRIPLSDLMIRNFHLILAGGAGALMSQVIRKNAMKLSDINRSLRKENIRRRHTELDLRKKQAELAFADKRKDEFLAMLAHELRNPLASMYAAIDILSQTDAQPQLKEEATSAVNKRLHALVRMVDDLLEVSRVTKGKILLCREKVELSQVLMESISALQTDLEQHEHYLHFNPTTAAGLFINADRTRLEQIFTNLLQNAIKYTDPRGHIWILVSSSETEITVRIKDSGIGMHQDMLSRVFGLFVQGDASLDRTRGGLGIGLTLVKQLVEQHGGTIRASSDGPGTGSEFSVVLPMCSASRQEVQGDFLSTHYSPIRFGQKASLSLVPSGNTLPALPNQGFKTLLVEDSPDVALLMSALLRRWGYNVEVATDGEMALQVFKEIRPNLVLLDIGLPKIDGYEVARKIRSEIHDHDAILIALTGYGRSVDRDRAKACGFNIHLTKPVPPPLLKRVLNEASTPY